MRSTQRNNDDKRAGRTGGKMKASRNEVATPKSPLERIERQLATEQESSSSLATRAVLSDDEYRARVAQKAYELYQKRQALTEKDDWLEGERLVKVEILRGEHGAGSV